MPNPTRGAEQVAKHIMHEWGLSVAPEKMAAIIQTAIDEAVGEYRKALTACVDALEVMRRGHGVDHLCYPALNLGRKALYGPYESIKPEHILGPNAKAAVKEAYAALNPEKEENPSGHK